YHNYKVRVFLHGLNQFVKFKGSFFCNVALIELKVNLIKGNLIRLYDALDRLQLSRYFERCALCLGYREALSLITLLGGLNRKGTPAVYRVFYNSVGIAGARLDDVVAIIQNRHLGIGEHGHSKGILYRYVNRSGAHRNRLVDIVLSGAVTREKPEVLLLVKAKGKVILRGIHRSPKVGSLPVVFQINHENVQSSKAGSGIRTKVKYAFIGDKRKAFIALCIHLIPQIFRLSKGTIGVDRYSEDVKPSLGTRAVRAKVKRLAIGR